MIIQTRLSMIKRRITSNQITQKNPDKMLVVKVHASSLENLVSQQEVLVIRISPMLRI